MAVVGRPSTESAVEAAAEAVEAAVETVEVETLGGASVGFVGTAVGKPERDAVGEGNSVTAIVSLARRQK